MQAFVDNKTVSDEDEDMKKKSAKEAALNRIAPQMAPTDQELYNDNHGVIQHMNDGGTSQPSPMALLPGSDAYNEYTKLNGNDPWTLGTAQKYLAAKTGALGQMLGINNAQPQQSNDGNSVVHIQPAQRDSQGNRVEITPSPDQNQNDNFNDPEYLKKRAAAIDALNDLKNHVSGSQNDDGND